MIYLIMAAGVVLLAAGLAMYRFRSRSKSTPRTAAPLKHALVNCPLCGSPLLSGENLVSRIYRPMTVPDQYCTVAGCPHCFPVCEPGVKRICPVCGKQVPPDGYLVARLFNRTNGKKHVLITGCSQCSRKITK